MKGIGMDKILLMFSGGVDSTGALYKLLTDEKYKDLYVIAYHINLINAENKHKAEARACKKIISYLRKKGFEFDYFESTVDFTGFRRMPWDTEACFCMGAMLAQSDYEIKYATTGTNATDPINEYLTEFPEERDRFYKVFKYITKSPQRNYEPINILTVMEHMTKKEVWNMLPKQLRKMTWYCRNPKYLKNKIETCGYCEQCINIKNIKKDR